MKKYIVTSGVFAGNVFFSKYCFNGNLLDFDNIGITYNKLYCMEIENVSYETDS
jgi:hypothetical protein